MSQQAQASHSYVSAYKCGWMPTNHEKYERFARTLLHGEDWSLGLKYFAMYWIDFSSDDYDNDDDDEDSDGEYDDEDDDEYDEHADDEEICRLYSPMLENSPARVHVEKRLLEHLRLQWSLAQKSKVRSVTILQNASPCHRCSKEYIKQLNKMKSEAAPGMEITLIFSSFFNILRPSCAKEKHTHQKNHSAENVEALANLRDAGIKLRTTNYRDWALLRQVLQLPDTYDQTTYSLSARRREDEALSADLKKLLI